MDTHQHRSGTAQSARGQASTREVLQSPWRILSCHQWLRARHRRSRGRWCPSLCV